jgi:hypothetical protein
MTGALPVASREAAEAPREAGSGTVMGVGDDDGGTTGGVEAKGGVGNRVGATGSGMVRRCRGW